MIIENSKQEAIFKFVREIYAALPFNNHLGLVVADVSAESASITIDMASQLVGNMAHGILHGGVTSSVLDTVGGIAITSAVLCKLDSDDAREMAGRISKLGTIDLRVDYLKPGRGEQFIATATVLRLGNRVAVTRMELVNQDGDLIAVGTASYSVA